MQRTVARIYLIMFALLLGLLILIGKTGVGPMGFVGFLFGCWLFFGVLPSRWIGVMLISKLRCKHCGLEVPAVDRWKIGSYTDHRERHILMAKNPIDGGHVGQIDCPQCSATILV